VLYWALKYRPSQKPRGGESSTCVSAGNIDFTFASKKFPSLAECILSETVN
jgi:hypothetical protein